MTVINVTDTATRAELVEALGHMSHRAAREMPVVGTVDHPTPWDHRHAVLDDLLGCLETAS